MLIYFYRGFMLLLATPLAFAALAEATLDYRHSEWEPSIGHVADVDYAPIVRWSPPGPRPGSRPFPSRRDRWDVTVVHTVDGRAHSHRFTGLLTEPDGETIPVFYDPDDPSRATLSDPRVYSSRTSATVAAVLLVLALLPRPIVDELTQRIFIRS